MPDYPGAIEYFVDQSRVFIGQNSHSAIVLHGTGGVATQTAQQLGDYFRMTTLMTSVHYGVDRSGVICQYVQEADGAAGNCCVEPGYDPFWDQFQGDNLNLHTLSIETVNDATNSLPLTDPQKHSLFKLVAYLSKKYNIPFSRIKSHASIATQSRAQCPGPAFRWDELETYLNGGNSMQVPAGWHDDGHALTAPNGVQITEGFRQFVLAHGWDPGNWPIMAASGLNPVEQGNPGLGSGTVQPFRVGVLAWTEQRGVYVMWIGQEYVALHQIWDKSKQDLKAAQTQIAQLQQQLQLAQQQAQGSVNDATLKDYANRLNQIYQIARIQQP